MAIITKEQLEQASVDADLLHRFRVGNSNETIPTEEGLKPTISGIVKQALQSASIDTLEGKTFITGATLTSENQALLDTASGEYYRWSGDLPTGGKVVPANSTPSGSGGIGPGKWLSAGQGAIRSDLQNGDGDLIGIEKNYPSAVRRTQNQFNNQFVSINDFIGDSFSTSLDLSVSFQNAVNEVEKSKPILVQSGTYTLTNDVNCDGKTFIFEEPVNINVKKLKKAIIHRWFSDGSISFGVGDSLQYSSKYRFGRTDGGPIGLQIGGAEPSRGSEGTVLFSDGYGGWSVAQPSRYGSAVEMAVQPSDIVGVMTTVSGSGYIDSNSGEPFTKDMLDRRIYFAGFTYRVKSFISSTRIELMNLNSSSVTFATNKQYEWQMVGVITTAKVSISGTAVTLISGEPFTPLTNTEYYAHIGNERITVSSVNTPDSLTLYSASTLQGEQTISIYSSVDDLSSAVRVHKSTGFGHEENVTLAAYASGKYQLHAGSSGEFAYPLIIGCQWDVDGEERSNISINPDGTTVIGGKYSATLQIPYNESKSASGVKITSNDFNEAYIQAVGPTANADLYLKGKGTGHIGLGKFVSQGGGTIVGYLEIKDESGGVRRLACI